MTISALLLLDVGLRRHWDGFLRDRPHLTDVIPVNCSEMDNLATGLDGITPDTRVVIIFCLTAYLADNVNREYIDTSAATVCADFLAAIRAKAVVSGHCNFCIVPPMRVNSPRWFHSSFPAVFRAFQTSMSILPVNVHVTPYREYPAAHFERDGRTLTAGISYVHMSDALRESEALVAFQV